MNDNKNSYDFSYFEDSTPYVRHSERQPAQKKSVPGEPVQNRPNRPVQRNNTPNRTPNRKSKFSGKAILIGAIVILVFVVGLIVTINLISNAVQNSALTVSEVTDSSVTLTWAKKNSAVGYHVYCAEKGSNDYQIIESIDNPDTLTATASALNQATPYSFYITAVTASSSENKFAKADSVLTLPAPPVLSAVSSENEGQIHLEWGYNDKASGYAAEYTKSGTEYSGEQRITISDPEVTSYDITGLEPGENYTVRMYSYIGKDDPVFSPPGEEQAVRVSRVEAQLESGAKFFDKYIDPDKPMVAFTFDDGPFDGVASDRILDILEKYDAKATFFMVGCYVEDHPENIRRKVELNMELGNHTWDHSKYGASITAEDIKRCSDIIYEVSGQRPTAFRPPGGAEGAAIESECIAEGMPIYLWNVNTEDYSSLNADSVYHMVMDDIKDGSIIGMHDVYESTADAVERMVPELISRGFQIVSAHDLVVAKTGKEPVAGEVYSHFTSDEYD